MIDDPNVILPLATSYTERGVAGFTHAVTNSEDQRKVNCMYELSKNPMTGKGTLTLSKRPGVRRNTSFSLGSASSQTVYLITRLFQAGSSFDSAIFYSDGTSIKCSSGVGTATLLSLSGTGSWPSFVDITAISNIPYIVLEIRKTINEVHRVFYSTAANIASSGGSWTEISDGDFTTSAGGATIAHRGKAEHMDGYMFKLTSNNLIINSDVNSLANWTASSFISKQIKQDFPRGLARLSNQIIAFGNETMEVFYNSGNTVGSPLGRIAQLHQRVGLMDTYETTGGHYYALYGKNLYFMGRSSGNSDNGLASIGVYAYDGQLAIKVSSSYIDKILSEQIISLTSIYTVAIKGQSGIAITWTGAGASTHRSLVFFPEWKEWFEWTSTVFSTINDGSYYISPSATNGSQVYSFHNTDNWADDGTNYQFLTQFRIPSNGSSRKRMISYGVDADTDTSANTISVDVSDDDCQSFYSLPSLDLTKDRKVNFRGGSFRKRHIRLQATDSRPKRIANFLARIE